MTLRAGEGGCVGDSCARVEGSTQRGGAHAALGCRLLVGVVPAAVLVGGRWSEQCQSSECLKGLHEQAQLTCLCWASRLRRLSLFCMAFLRRSAWSAREALNMRLLMVSRTGRWLLFGYVSACSM